MIRVPGACALLLVALAARVDAGDVVFRATLAGRIAALLTIDAAGTAPGQARYDTSGADGLSLSGRGGAGDGPFAWREVLEPRSGPEKPTGTFSGTLDDGGRRGHGDWRSADGTKTLPLALDRVARIETVASKDGRADAEYPIFDAPRLTPLNERLAAEARGELAGLEQAVRASRRDLQGVDVPREILDNLAEQRFVDVEHAGPDVVSLLWTRYSFTGGAHGNSALAAANYAIGADGAVRPFGLWDALRRSQAAIRAISALLVADLRHQDASEVVDGRVTGFRDGLEKNAIPVTVVPAGLAFHFAPYEVGPYAQGAFRVVVPTRELAAYLRPDGPLAARAAR